MGTFALVGAEGETSGIAAALDQLHTTSNRPSPVQFTATITLVDRERSLAVVQDDSGAMAIHTDLDGNWKIGGRVLIEGTRVVPWTRAFPSFPDHPDKQSVVSSFETPAGHGWYYLSRLRGWLCPPTNGAYTFWIASDDAGEFWLGDSPSNALQKVVGNPVGNPTGLREWNRYPLQRSQPVELHGGRKYYVEALHIQSYGRDGFSLAWEGPGVDRSVIDGRHLSPWMEPANASSGKNILGGTNGLRWECWTNFFVHDFDSLRSTNPRENIVRIESLKVTPLPAEKLPSPQQLEYGDTLGVVPSFQWVELEGDVRFASAQEGRLRMELHQDESALEVRVLDWKSLAANQLLHSRIRLRGVVEHTFDAAGGLMGSVVWVPDERQIRVLERLQNDLDSVMRLSICEIDPANPEMRWGRRIKTRGRIAGQTNGLTMIEGRDSYQGFVSRDGTNWFPLGPKVEISTSNSILSGLAVLSRHDQGQSTAVFSQLKGFGADWRGSDIGRPVTSGSFHSGDGTLTVTGGGRKMGERSDQLYLVHQPSSEEVGLSAHLDRILFTNSATQVGLMFRESPDSRAAFATVLFTPAAGPAFLYRRSLGEPIIGFESRREYGKAEWFRLVRQKSLLRVQAQAGAVTNLETEVEAQGIIRWQDRTPVLAEASFEPVPANDRDTLRAAVQQRPSIPSFVARVLHPPEPYLPGRMLSPKLTGVVTFCGDYNGTPVMFIQSGDENGVQLGWSEAGVRPDFQPGQIVETVGQASVRKFPVILQPTELKSLGWGSLPRALPYSTSLTKSRAGQARWVEAVGIVRSETDDGMLSLMTKDGPLAVWTGTARTTPPQKYLDARLRARGVLSLDAAANACLLVPALDFLEVIEDSPKDPFALPSFSIQQLAAHESAPDQTRRMRSGGIVTCSLPRGLYMQDAADGAYVRTELAATFRPGDVIDVVGLPEKRPELLTLNDAVVRKVGGGNPPEPIQLLGPEQVTNTLSGKLVRLDANLIEQRRQPNMQTLTVRMGPSVFEACLLADESRRLPQIPAGSRLKITGVCQFEPGSRNSGLAGAEALTSLATFKIWLPNRDAVAVLSKPSWWTLKRMAGLGGLFASGLLAALIWVRVLRRRVTQKTNELHATMQQLHKETRTAAVLSERDRLAGEIHDSLEQGLTAIMLQLDAAHKHSAQTEDVQRYVQRARSMAEFSRAEVQHAVWDMQSPLLDNADLGMALKHVVSQISSGKPEVKVEVAGKTSALPSGHEHHLLRIAQEAITNALKHAHANEIRVTLNYSPTELTLTIVDDGGGFPADTVQKPSPAGHFGLHGIRARARKIGATLNITSQSGQGTTITVRVPLQETNTTSSPS